MNELLQSDLLVLKDNPDNVTAGGFTLLQSDLLVLKVRWLPVPSVGVPKLQSDLLVLKDHCYKHITPQPWRFNLTFWY